MHGIESRKKTYVEAVVDIDPDGRQRPLAIYWGDGRCFVEARGEHEGRRPRDPLYR